MNIQTLLAPVPGSSPTGTDPRSDMSSVAAFQRLRDLRAQARAQERAADAEEDAAQPTAEWRQIVAAAGEILAGQSKDLEVAAMMVEGLTRLHGYAGLRDGFRLLHALVERHWDGLHPAPDEDGLATRLRPITGLNGEGAEGTLIQPIRKIPLIRGQQADYALWQIMQAGEVATLDDDRRQQRLAAGAQDLDAVTAAAQAMDATEVSTTLADIVGAQDAFLQLCHSLDQLCGAESPPTSNIRNVLEAARDALFLALGDRGQSLRQALGGSAGSSAAAPPAPRPQPNGSGPDASPAAPPADGIRDREDALRLVEQAAAWFRRVEPQAPISYTLQEAVRRARLPLPDLIDELIRDDAARGDFLVVAGIRSRGA
ncbi:type VI secretion system protein TssA [Inquilinus sp. Marseille-Q2685]|uniref:type VI secretion system protein TssA n=1 Tax=Inquilinus sp. Marseille-Q2685 TaxID=2866581 RepID=UPI001CE3FF07|nr:type VI secretion system protein TssA [Inquilinus sp. Marseille-Q2685]